MFLYNNETEKKENTKDLPDIAMEKLLKSRTIIISGEINQALAEKVCAQLLILEEMSNDPIKIFINSQGGHVESGDTIHDMIKFVKPRVIMIGTGWVASAGITIYLAADKENRYSLPNTRYMIHQPLGGFNGQATDIGIEAKEILRVRQRINTIMHADQIIVLDEGRIVGIGTHKELLKKCKVYKEIALSQLSKEELENE